MVRKFWLAWVRKESMPSIVVNRLSKAFCSVSAETPELAACCCTFTELSASIFEVEEMRLSVVALTASIWSSTSFWFSSACAVITAVRSAVTVVVRARSTPCWSLVLLSSMTPIER